MQLQRMYSRSIKEDFVPKYTGKFVEDCGRLGAVLPELVQLLIPKVAEKLVKSLDVISILRGVAYCKGAGLPTEDLDMLSDAVLE